VEVNKKNFLLKIVKQF